MLPYVENGRLYRYDGLCIDEVSLFMVGGTLHKFGSYDNVFKSFKAWLNIYSDRGNDCLFLSLANKGLNPEDCCYVLRTLLLKPNGDFAKQFREKVDEPYFIEWLRGYMKDVPISLSKD